MSKSSPGGGPVEDGGKEEDGGEGMVQAWVGHFVTSITLP